MHRRSRKREEVSVLDKTILQDYIDACELVKETEAEIRKLDRKKRTVVKIQGTTFTVKDDSHLRYEEKALAQRKARAEEVRLQVDEWLLTVPIRMQRIIRYRYLEGLTWEQVAMRMGRRATADSVRKELERFFEKN